MQRKSTFNIPRFAIVMAVSLLLAFMPFTVNLNKYRITLERNEAHAIAPVFAGALAFLEECAAVAGFASVGDFIATGAGVTAVASGLTIGTAAGVNFGNTASDNLGNLIDAADYPAWDTLSSSEQTNWGSKENYDAAKYNSLMSAFGLGEDYAAYQSWGGNGSFEFSSSGKRKLEQLGNIGNNWLSGIGNSVNDVKAIVTNRNAIDNWAPGTQYTHTKAETETSWPNTIPDTLNYSQGTSCAVQVSTLSYNLPTYYFNNAVYILVIVDDQPTNGYIRAECIAFSKNAFQYKSGNGSYSNARTTTISGNTFYKYGWSPSMPCGNGYSWVSNVPYNEKVAGSSIDMELLASYLLYGDSSKNYPKVVDYPTQDINSGSLDNTEVYYPEDGINVTVNWVDFTTPTENPENPNPGIMSLLRHIDSDLHKFNFYNNGDLKVHDEGVFTELSDIYSMLMEISGKMGNWGDIGDAPEIIGDFDFDDIEEKVPNLLETISELAPFGSVLLLSEMYTILANYSGIESPVMTFPFDFGGLPGQDTELEIDLSWLDDIKPVINFFCILMLLMAIAHATIRIVELEAAS